MTNTNSPIIDAEQPELQEGEYTASPYLAGRKVINFMRIRKSMTLISLSIVLIGVFAIFYKGLNLGLDFTGGVVADLQYTHDVQPEALASALSKAGFKDAVVQYAGSDQALRVRMPVQGHIGNISEQFGQAAQLPGNAAKVNKMDSVGAQVGSELYTRAVFAILLSLFLMFIYVAVRFEFKLATGAVISLIHDTLFTIGLFAIFQWPFDLAVLAAVLALIGYSLNDTIVVYDRVRENFKRVRGATPIEIVNIALTETLQRTFMTVATVLLVVLAMFFVGGEGLKWFSVALLVGLFAGTYSSIYIATNYALLMGLKRQDFMAKVVSDDDEQEEIDD